MNQVKLVVVGGAAQATELVIRPPVVLGRGHEASIPLPHPLVSRLHCEIVQHQGRLLVRDLGSLNGTYVGNQRVSEAELPSGELLTVGSVTFRAEYEVAADLFAPPSEVDAPETAEDSRLSVADLPATFEGQSETDDHPLDPLASAHPVIDAFPEIQAEKPPLATPLEPELPAAMGRDAAGESQLSFSDLPMAFDAPLEATPLDDASPDDALPDDVPLTVDIPAFDDPDIPVPDKVPLATVLEADGVAEVEVDEDSELHPSPSGEETRDVVESEMGGGEATADVRPAPAPSARPDSLDFSVAPELDASGSGTQSIYDSTTDEDLKRFLKDLE